MRKGCPLSLLVYTALLASCATAPAPGPDHANRSSIAAADRVQVVFKSGKTFARQGGHEWQIAEVDRNQLRWAPEGRRFAYLKAQTRRRNGQQIYHVVIRTITGESVNEFATYRPGRPSQLEWLDEQRLCYRGAAGEGGPVYLVHHAETGEIAEIHRGTAFIWSPGRKRLAYVAGKKRRQTIKVDGRTVWPNPGASARRRDVVGELVWSPDGQGLTFLTRDRRRRTHLVVMLVIEDEDTHLSWPLPSNAAHPGNRLFWAENKVLIGQSLLQPRFAASWTQTR